LNFSHAHGISANFVWTFNPSHGNSLTVFDLASGNSVLILWLVAIPWKIPCWFLSYSLEFLFHCWPSHGNSIRFTHFSYLPFGISADLL
jgi:hypothetical protein